MRPAPFRRVSWPPHKLMRIMIQIVFVVKGQGEPSREPPLGYRPRQARGVAAHERVYDTAIAQFAEKGVAATRVEDIVAAAEVAWGTFYRYFPRKEDVLLEAAVRQFNDQLLPLVESDLADPSRSCREKALRLLVAMLEPGDHPAQLRAEIIKQVIEQRDRFSAMIGAGEHPLVLLVARIVSQGQERGEVRTDVDRFTLAGVLLAGTVWPAVYAYGTRSPASQSASGLQALVQRVVGILWRGLEPVTG